MRDGGGGRWCGLRDPEMGQDGGFQGLLVSEGIFLSLYQSLYSVTRTSTEDRMRLG